jgi:hypothetical protein
MCVCVCAHLLCYDEHTVQLYAETVLAHTNTLGSYVPKEEMTERERGLPSVWSGFDQRIFYLVFYFSDGVIGRTQTHTHKHTHTHTDTLYILSLRHTHTHTQCTS